MKNICIAVFLFFIILIPFYHLLADTSIGASPSEIIADINPGEKKEFIINISRSNAETEMKFDISLQNPVDYFILPENSIILASGEREKEYHFFIDSASLNQGIDKNIINFILVPVEDNHNVTVKYGLSVKTAINVLPKTKIEKKLNNTWLYVIIAVFTAALFFMALLFFFRKKKINQSPSR